MNSPNYLIRFTPILKHKIWGGNKIANTVKNNNDEPIGESWEISGVNDSISIVKNGALSGKSLTELVETYQSKLVGKSVYAKYGSHFPLLIKFIDAAKDLSIQVHPNDKLANERHNCSGKTEMWYIMDCDEGARLNLGFKKGVSKTEYLQSVKNQTVEDILHFEDINIGDAFFIHAGLVHAIGGGILLAEIQQTSDITYRIYDWNRKDKNGNSRELHTDLAIDAIDFSTTNDYKLTYEDKQNSTTTLTNNQFFKTSVIDIDGSLSKDYSNIDSFSIYICVEGEIELSTNGNIEVIQERETLLKPASLQEIHFKGKGKILEVYMGN